MSLKALFRLLGIAILTALLLSSEQVLQVRALVGDLDFSGVVDEADLAIIDAAYPDQGNTTPDSPNWDPRADLNHDEYINLKDLALAGRSFGETFNFYPYRRVSNGYNANPDLTNPYWCDAVADAFGRVHVIWEENRTSQDYLFYTQLDAAGNALIEDVQISNDSLYARLAVGPDGSAHIVYQRHYSNVGLYYTHLNPDGSFVDGGFKIPNSDNCANPAIAVDQYNHAHIAYTQSYDKAMYTIIGDNDLLLPTAQLNPGSKDPASSFAVAVSPDGARHILWRQATGVGGGELRYTRIGADGVLTANNQTAAVLQGNYNPRHYYLSADSLNAVHLLYYDFRDGEPGIYWARIDPDGTMTAETLITYDVYASATSSIMYTIDSSDRLHLVAPWDNAGGNVGYALLNRDGEILTPFQRVFFESETYKACIVINPEGEAMIIAPAYSGSPAPLLISSTVTDPAAYDPTRADLVLDRAHMLVADHLLKINESADITLTVTNGGPAPASAVSVTFAYPDIGGATSAVNVSTGDIPAFSSVELHQLIPVPDFEEVDAWEVTVSASTSSLETSSSNNSVNVPFGVVPPPRMFNLEVLPYDETNSPTSQDLAEPLQGATLSLNCPDTAHTQTIADTDIFNIFWDIPLDLKPASAPLYATECTVTLTKPGFSSASTTVSAQRYSTENPYAILLSVRPIELYVNTWGSLHGTIRDNNGDPIIGAMLKLDSGQQTTTDSSGAYVLEKIPAGAHTMRIWAAGFEAIPAAAVSITQGVDTQRNLTMQPTQKAEVFGVVRNTAGQALSYAQVKFKKDGSNIASLTTGDGGTFAFATDPYEDTSTYALEVSLEHYLTVTETIALTPGIPLEWNITLEYVDDGGDMSASGSITSWVQDERWCKAYGDDEDLPLRTIILQKIGSKWCPSFQTVVNWGAFDYALGLNYHEDVSGNTVTELLINFTNQEFISYDVSSGRWHAGGETLAVTAQRIDWIELIALDSAGNPVGEYAWHDEAVRYSSAQTDPVNPTWRVPINALAPTWSQAYIRIYYTVGQYDAMEENHFRDWNPPADLGLAGSGSPSGANRQVITWKLSNNTSSMRYSLADYQSAYNNLDNTAMWGLQTACPAPGLDTYGIQAFGTISLVPLSTNPAILGAPYYVDLVLSEFESRPVYALQFSLSFDETYLSFAGFQQAPEFGGPFGSWFRELNLQTINTEGKIANAAVVRLAAPAGLANGSAVRLVFVPVQETPEGKTTKIDLNGFDLADSNSNLFDPASSVDLYLKVQKPLIFLPAVLR